MKGFNGRSAVEEYISTHPLSFSTPDLILKEFVIWLCELVDDPYGKSEEKIPRIILYTSGKEKRGIDSLGSVSKSEKDLMAKQLLELSNVIIFGSLVLHIVFGGVMGFCARLAVT